MDKIIFETPILKQTFMEELGTKALPPTYYFIAYSVDLPMSGVTNYNTVADKHPLLWLEQFIIREKLNLVRPRILFWEIISEELYDKFRDRL